MDAEQFKKCSTDMVNYIVHYLDNIRDRCVVPDVEPGYLHKLIPPEAPQKPESWEDIMSDIENKIMPGITHWQHPRFHAYFSCGNAYPNILADMLCDGLGVQGFSWVTSPAATELETIMLDWMGKMMGLPDEFLYNGENSKGGGVLQSSASESIFVSCLAARNQVMKRLRMECPHEEEAILRSKLVAYCSRAAHSSSEKAAHMTFVKIKLLETDDNQSVQGSTLRKVLEKDIANGLVPFWVSASLGTTSTVGFDNLSEIGPICEEFNIWLHIDAAYAGSSFICPELRGPLRGIEYAMSIEMNPYKFMLVSSDCSCMWVTDRYKLTEAFGINPVYLQHSYSAAIDYRHWGISLSHRFRSLKLWFVIRTYGVEGLQNYIRGHCRLAKLFMNHVRQDKHFEIVTPLSLAVVCFRLKGSNDLNRKLLMNINSSGELHLTPTESIIKGKSVYIIRFVVCCEHATESDIDSSWNIIRQFASDLLLNIEDEKMDQINLKTVKEHDHINSSGDRDDAFEIMDRKNEKSTKCKQCFFNSMISDPEIFDIQLGKALANDISQDSVTESKKEVHFDPKIDIKTLRNLLLNEDFKEGGILNVIVMSRNEQGEIYYSFTKPE